MRRLSQTARRFGVLASAAVLGAVGLAQGGAITGSAAPGDNNGDIFVGPAGVTSQPNPHLGCPANVFLYGKNLDDPGSFTIVSVPNGTNVVYGPAATIANPTQNFVPISGAIPTATLTAGGATHFKVNYVSSVGKQKHHTFFLDCAGTPPAGPATPTLTTQAAVNGDIISDTATLSGGVNPTGTITFTVYGPNDATCGGTPAFTSSPIAVDPNQDPVIVTSPSFTATTPGVYRFVVSYTSADTAANSSITSGCNDANEAVTSAGGTLPISTTPTPIPGVTPPDTHPVVVGGKTFSAPGSATPLVSLGVNNASKTGGAAPITLP